MLGWPHVDLFALKLGIERRDITVKLLNWVVTREFGVVGRGREQRLAIRVLLLFSDLFFSLELDVGIPLGISFAPSLDGVWWVWFGLGRMLWRRLHELNLN